MKKIIFLFFTIASGTASFAQNNVGIGTASPNASAILDLSSTTKGLLIPRMTTAQRSAVSSPATGLLVFDTDTKTLWAYDGAAWKNLNTSGSGGSLTLPYAGSNASGTSFQLTNTLGGGTAISGKANGSGANNIGIYGESFTGTAVKGYTNDAGSVAVFGSSLAGTGIRAYSFAGTALEVTGNVKISGGNTNPTTGAVLTSDADGNATWKNNRIAFSAMRDEADIIPYGTATRLKFNPGSNYGGGFNNNTSPTDPNIFIAPVSGYYYFSATCYVKLVSSVYNITSLEMGIGIVGASTNFAFGKANQANNSTTDSRAIVQAQSGIHLNAGTKVEVFVTHSNFNNLPVTVVFNKFDGFLVFAD